MKSPFIKHKAFWWLLLVLALSLLLIGGTNGLFTPKTPTPDYTPQDPLPYVLKIEGTWFDEDYVAHGGEIAPLLRIEIDPMNIVKDEVRIVVSDYCRDSIADFLHFKIRDDRLVYVGATLDDCAFDLERIDYMEIWYEDIGPDRILFYEACEAEYQNFLQLRMRRTEMVQ